MKPSLPLMSLLLGCAHVAPALAFDCAAARSPVEKAICANTPLLALDDQINQAYGALRAAGDAGAKAALQGSQRAWLALRDACANQDKVNACLATRMNGRLNYLTGAPQAGPGAESRLVPLIRWRNGRGKSGQQIETFAFAGSATAGEKRFNELVRGYVDELIADMSGEPDRETNIETTAAVTYASARLVSVHMDSYTMAEGAAHPNMSSRDVNVDLARGRELGFADLFDGTAAHKVVSLCRAQVLQDKKERGVDQPEAQELSDFDAALDKSLRDLRTWSFTADHVSVTFDRYALGSYAEGGYGCDLAYADLRPLAKPGAWVVE